MAAQVEAEGTATKKQRTSTLVKAEHANVVVKQEPKAEEPKAEEASNEDDDEDDEDDEEDEEEEEEGEL